MKEWIEILIGCIDCTCCIGCAMCRLPTNVYLAKVYKNVNCKTSYVNFINHQELLNCWVLHRVQLKHTLHKRN